MAQEKKSKVSILTNGIIKENPVLRLVLGTCSILAVTTAVSSALGMGAAFTFVLVCSNIMISLLRKVIPGKVHLPCFIVSPIFFQNNVSLEITSRNSTLALAFTSASSETSGCSFLDSETSHLYSCAA